MTKIYRVNTIQLKKPSSESGQGKRSTFALVHTRAESGGKRESSTIVDNRIKNINNNLKSGLYDFNHALFLIEKIRKEYKERLCTTIDRVEETYINKVNAKLIDKYIKNNINLRTAKPRSIEKARSQVKKVGEYMDGVSLVSAQKHEIIKKWESVEIAYSSKFRLRTELNALLKLAERDFIIHMKDKSKILTRDKTYIAMSDLLTLNSSLFFENDAHLVNILFFTGIRIGELFGLNEDHIDFRKSIISIDRQMLPDGITYDDPKSDSFRSIAIPKSIHSDLKFLIKQDSAWRKSNRRSFGIRLKTASKRAFSDKKQKQVSPHGLRRSYSKFMYARGFNISELSLLMGDKEDVIRDFYLGLDASSEMLKSISKRLGDI